jgi:hypothetical protein
MIRPGSGCGRRLGGMPRPQALALGQEGPREGTPAPIGPAVVDPLGPPGRQKAADALAGGEGHRLPARVLSLRIAAAAGTVRARAPPALGQRAPVDRPGRRRSAPAPGLAGPVGRRRPLPWSRRPAGWPARPFLTRQRPTPPANERREGLDRHHGGGAGRPPRRPGGGAPTGWPQAVDVRLRRARPGPGRQDAQAPAQPTAVRRVCRERAP